MKFPQFFSRVNSDSGRVSARGWSETSQEEADANALARLERILNFLRTGRKNEQQIDGYSYTIDGVICEEVIDRIFDEDNANEIAVFSRNAYGSLVLNSTRLMFVDIDIKPDGTLQRWKHWLLGKQGMASPEQRAINEIIEWQRSNPRYALRIYRTAAGLRLLVSNQPFDGFDGTAKRILNELKSDRLYRRLCESQQCFRARLSPKPWRIGAGRPPVQFPYRNKDAENEFKQWHDRYVQLAKQHSVCTYLMTLGTTAIHPDLAAIIEQHDALSVGENPLA